MGKRLAAAAIGLSVAAALSASSVAESEEYFDGPYIGHPGVANWGYAAGRAKYTFLTDGHYNTAPGQSFTIDMPINELGAPLGILVGRNWQYERRVFGIEAHFHTTVVRHDNIQSPDSIHPGDHEYDFKPHWLASVTGVAGVALGRVMLYAQAGPAVGHPVAQIDDKDNNLRIWTPQARLGVVAGAGVRVAVTPWLQFGLAYRAYALAPLHVTGNSIDRGTGLEEPNTETNHLVQASAHSLTAQIVYRFGQSERVQASSAPFDWGGLYVGTYLGALHQIGGQIGYDRMFGRSLAGVSFQAGIGICCGISYDFALNARVGHLIADDVLAYFELMGAYQTGTFFDVVDGAYYAAGLGLEFALVPRTTAFIEAKVIGAPGFGFADAYIQGGFNFHFRQR